MKFFIICPMFNSSTYILRTIKSVLKQTFSNWELVLVDDGSSDDTEFICLEEHKKDNRITVLKKENEGPFLAREYGIKYVNGKTDDGFVLFLDSDDILKKYALEILWNYIKANPDIDFLCFNSDWVDKSGIKTNKYYEISDNVFLNNNKSVIQHAVILNTLSYIWSFAINIKTISRCPKTPDEYSKLMLAEDYVKLSHIFEISKQSLLISESLYIHFVYETSITASLNSTLWVDWLKGIDYVNSSTISRYPDLKNSISNQRLESFFKQIVYILEMMFCEKKKRNDIQSYIGFVNTLFLFNCYKEKKLGLGSYYNRMYLLICCNNYFKIRRLYLRKKVFRLLEKKYKSAKHLIRSIYGYFYKFFKWGVK